MRTNAFRLLSRARMTPASSAQPRVLFCMERWCDLPENGPANATHNFYGSLAATGTAAQLHFHFDEHLQRMGSAGDAALLALCDDARPDLVILTLSRLNPDFETLRRIRHDLGIRIVVLWHDFVDLHNRMIARSMSDFADLHVAIDACSFPEGDDNIPDNFLPLWTPQDPRIFHDPRRERDIDVSFVGSVREYDDRKAGIAALRSAGIRVHQSGGQREAALSIAEYTAILQRSKITINFSVTATHFRQGGPRQNQIKGRVFEALHCGAMLLEGDDSETKRWLAPGRDYVAFNDEDDLVESAGYYLENETARLGIARCGHESVNERYSAEKFWRAILERVL